MVFNFGAEREREADCQGIASPRKRVLRTQQCWLSSMMNGLFFFNAKGNLFFYFISFSSPMSQILWLHFTRDDFYILVHIKFLCDPFLCRNIFGCLCKWPHKGIILYINPIYCPPSKCLHSYFVFCCLFCYDHPRQVHSLWYEHSVMYNIGCWRHFRIEHTYTHTHTKTYIHTHNSSVENWCALIYSLKSLIILVIRWLNFINYVCAHLYRYAICGVKMQQQ